MKIASWNVNSVKARMDCVLAWLKEVQPDVVCLQEIKTADEAFPTLEFEALGYNCSVHGQKSYNGVAILSKQRPEDVVRGLPEGHGDDHARYIEAAIPGASGIARVASIYAPNGNPPGSDKFVYKLAWMDRLRRHISRLLLLEEPVVLTGDFNVIPSAADCYDPRAWEGDALFQPETRAAWRRVLSLGFTDAFRACHDSREAYTFWDYQAGAWQKNKGIRIDHILLSPQAADRLVSSTIDKRPRGWDKPSDHVPIWCELEI
jgi:exodeoxyribonuclease III